MKNSPIFIGGSSAVPLRFGAGIKDKVLEALDQGVPVVTTAIDTEGIPMADEVMVVTTDAKDMASKLIALYDDRDRLEALSRDGQTLINKNNFSTEAVLKVIADNFLIELMSFFYELPRHHFIQGVGRSACRSE